MASAYSREEFIKLLIEQFPFLESAVLDEGVSGLIYLEVSCLTNYANSCLHNGRLLDFERVVTFFYQTVNQVDSTAKDALYLNFLGDLEMPDNTPIHQAARAVLHPEELEFWAKWRARQFGENYLLDYLAKP